MSGAVRTPVLFWFQCLYRLSENKCAVCSASPSHRFELTFRTLSVQRMRDRLHRAGFVVDRVLGDYRGRPWDARADVWIILAKKV